MLSLENNGRVATLTLRRPEVRNAFNAELIASLTDTLNTIAGASQVLVLKGEGKTFSAGADLGWMKACAERTQQENIEDAQQLAELFYALDRLPQPVIASVQGAALGGGLGLVACADIVVAADGTKFGLTEVRLGLAPAVIAPFVIDKMGPAACRRYFLTGEMFDADTAQSLGLVHEVVKESARTSKVKDLVDVILGNGPEAVQASKALVRMAKPKGNARVRDETCELIARLRVSPEGQEGLQAFLEKREANWK